MKLRPFLLGILVGQLVMLPYVIHLIRNPRIEAMTISDLYYNHKDTQYFEIKHLENDIKVGGDTLHIYIASEDEVNRQFRTEYPGDSTVVDGFYNDQTNTIWCVYDPLVLYHEIKHVTEGAYHR